MGAPIKVIYQYLYQLGSEQDEPPAKIEVSEAQQNTILGWIAELQQRLLQVEQHRNQTQNRLEHLAHFDALTGLANRRRLVEQLEHSIRNPNNNFAVVFLDLDGFKQVNDTFGHDIGDQLLIQISRRLCSLLRTGDLVARMGGDEFVILLNNLRDKECCTPLLERLIKAIAEPIWISNNALQVTASVGVTFYPQTNEVAPDILLRQADQAMYISKRQGKNSFTIFDIEQELHHDQYTQGQLEIKRGLENHEFVIFYQPKVEMKSGAVIGLEALIRWQHPEQGLLPPSYFLPFINQDKLEIEVGRYVLNKVMEQVNSWRKMGYKLPISVNISAIHLAHPDFEVELKELLDHHQLLDSRLIEIEILETSALEDIESVRELMFKCATLGVTFALDDFGTGYSSLSYLKRLPLDTVKVDQIFVRDLLNDHDDHAILHGISQLAESLNLNLIAEGVETEEHGLRLQELGYTLAQGYAIARPMPGEEVLVWCKTWSPPQSWQNFVTAND